MGWLQRSHGRIARGLVAALARPHLPAGFAERSRTVARVGVEGLVVSGATNPSSSVGSAGTGPGRGRTPTAAGLRGFPAEAAVVADDGRMSEPYETGRAAEVDVSTVTSREDVVDVIHAMVNDLRKHRDDWGNTTLESFLDALATSIEDLDQGYADRGEVVPDQPSWKLVAELLVTASAYE